MIKTDQKLINQVKTAKLNQKILEIYQKTFERYMQHERSKVLVEKQLVNIKKNMVLLHNLKNYPIGEL